MQHLTRFLCATLALASACSTNASTDALGSTTEFKLSGASPVRTDSLLYRLARRPSEYRAFVTATYVNRTGATVYFARCGGQSQTPMYDVVRTGADSTRRLFIDWAWACVGGVPTGAISAGDSVSIRAWVGSVDQPNMRPALDPQDLVGLMRIRLGLCRRPAADSDYCESLPAAERESNAFLVSY